MKQKYCIFATNIIFMLANAISNVFPVNFIAIDYHVNAIKEKNNIWNAIPNFKRCIFAFIAYI